MLARTLPRARGEAEVSGTAEGVGPSSSFLPLSRSGEGTRTLGSFSEECAAGIARQLLRVLVYIHDKGIAHRDLKGEVSGTAAEGVPPPAPFCPCQGLW